MVIWATVPQVDKPASFFAVASFASCLHPSLLVSMCSLLSFRCVPTGQVFEMVVWRAILQFGIFLGNCYILPHFFQDCPCDVLRTPRQPRSEAKMLQIYLDKKGPDRLALVTGGVCSFWKICLWTNLDSGWDRLEKSALDWFTWFCHCLRFGEARIPNSLKKYLSFIHLSGYSIWYQSLYWSCIHSLIGSAARVIGWGCGPLHWLRWLVVVGSIFRNIRSRHPSKWLE